MKGSGEEVRHHRGDRERAENDKQKERRPREEEEMERSHHRDRTSSKKSASDRSHRLETQTEVCMHLHCLYTFICRSWTLFSVHCLLMDCVTLFPMYHFCDPGCSKGV